MNLTGGWGGREVTRMAARQKGNIHTEIPRLDNSYLFIKYPFILQISIDTPDCASYPGNNSPITVEEVKQAATLPGQADYHSPAGSKQQEKCMVGGIHVLRDVEGIRILRGRGGVHI